MKKITAILLTAILLISATACGKPKDANKENKESTATNVTSYTAVPKDVAQTVSYTGELKAAETASVTCMASAKITNVLVDVGDYVSAGTTLLTLDTASLKLQYDQAVASYNSALAAYNSTTGGSTQQQILNLEQNLSAAKTSYNTALDSYNREKALFDIGATSEINLTNAKTALENAQLNLDTAQKNYDLTVQVVTPETSATAKASVDSAKAAVALAQNNLNNASVTAPISGYIASKNVNRGQMASAGIELFTIKNTGSYDAEISVTESVIPSVTVGTPATVTVKSAGVEAVSGSVSLVNPTKNAQTGLYTVRVTVANSNDALKEGMFADITLKTAVSANGLAVPSEALIQEGEGYYVYVISGDTAEKRDVETGISDGTYTEITLGISENEQIVVSGKEYVSEINNKVHVTGEYENE